MFWLLQSFLIAYLVSVLHILVMAATGRYFRISIQQVSFGFGGTLLKKGVFRLGWVPFGGYVRFADSRADSLSKTEWYVAWDHQSVLTRVAVLMSGHIVILCLSFSVLQKDAWDSFISAFIQIPYGALSPLSAAQDMLSSGSRYAATHPLVAFSAVLATKFSAYNLFPLAQLNGGQALIVMATKGAAPESLELKYQQWSIFLLLALVVSWVIGIGFYVMHAES